MYLAHIKILNKKINMKKILLFVSIVFLTLFSNKTNAQTIDSLIVSTYIECPGNSGVINVYITNATPSVDYSIILQNYSLLPMPRIYYL